MLHPVVSEELHEQHSASRIGDAFVLLEFATFRSFVDPLAISARNNMLTFLSVPPFRLFYHSSFLRPGALVGGTSYITYG